MEEIPGGVKPGGGPGNGNGDTIPTLAPTAQEVQDAILKGTHCR